MYPYSYSSLSCSSHSGTALYEPYVASQRNLDVQSCFFIEENIHDMLRKTG